MTRSHNITYMYNLYAFLIFDNSMYIAYRNLKNNIHFLLRFSLANAINDY